jgi:hypothetical protein
VEADNTPIAAGTLQLGNGTTTGSIVGNVINNATLAFAPSLGTPLSLSGVISSSGVVVQIGPGMTTLPGANTYAGGTFIKGTLQLGDPTINGGTTGIIIGNVADNGTLVFDRSNVVTFRMALALPPACPHRTRRARTAEQARRDYHPMGSH